MLISMASQIWDRRKARSSCRMPDDPPSRRRGIQITMAARAAAARVATTPKVTRQPAACPIQVPAGTPTTFATVMPVNSRATARTAFPGGASSAATIEAMPKKAPCASAVTIRAIISSRKSGAAAHATSPTRNITIKVTSARRRDTDESSAATKGEPKATLSA